LRRGIAIRRSISKDDEILRLPGSRLAERDRMPPPMSLDDAACERCPGREKYARLHLWAEKAS
jgi:hypothetical protein